MPFHVEGSMVFRDGRPIFQAPAPVRFWHLAGERIVILYDGYEIVPRMPNEWTKAPEPTPDLLKVINSNVLMLDAEGNIIWRLYLDHDIPHWFTALEERGPGRAYVRTSCDWGYDLDTQTGILSNLVQDRG